MLGPLQLADKPVCYNNNVLTQPLACELSFFPRYKYDIFHFVSTKVGRKAVIEELDEIEVLIKTGIPRSNSASGTTLLLLFCKVWDIYWETVMRHDNKDSEV